jgi:hypothetical protein
MVTVVVARFGIVQTRDVADLLAELQITSGCSAVSRTDLLSRCTSLPRVCHLNRLLACWDRATACYAAAAQAAGWIGENQAVVLRSRLGQGAVDHGQGELAAVRSAAEVGDVRGRPPWSRLRADARLLRSRRRVVARGYVRRGATGRVQGLAGAARCSQPSGCTRCTTSGLARRRSALGESTSALQAILRSPCDLLLRVSVLIGLMNVDSSMVRDTYANRVVLREGDLGIVSRGIRTDRLLRLALELRDVDNGNPSDRLRTLAP